MALGPGSRQTPAICIKWSKMCRNPATSRRMTRGLTLGSVHTQRWICSPFGGRAAQYKSWNTLKQIRSSRLPNPASDKLLQEQEARHDERSLHGAHSSRDALPFSAGCLLVG